MKFVFCKCVVRERDKNKHRKQPLRWKEEAA